MKSEQVFSHRVEYDYYKTIYICEVCNTENDERDEAEQHEKVCRRETCEHQFEKTLTSDYNGFSVFDVCKVCKTTNLILEVYKHKGIGLNQTFLEKVVELANQTD